MKVQPAVLPEPQFPDVGDPTALQAFEHEPLPLLSYAQPLAAVQSPSSPPLTSIEVQVPPPVQVAAVTLDETSYPPVPDAHEVPPAQFAAATLDDMLYPPVPAVHEVPPVR